MYRIYMLMAVLAIFWSCEEQKGAIVAQDKRTMIVYINADNNLYNNRGYGALKDINEMEMGWSDDPNLTVLVYLNSARNLPQFYKIIHDEDMETIASPVVYKYSAMTNASDPRVLSQVLSDAMAIAPADSYALMLWSHGTGWIPKGLYNPLRSGEAPATYTFGQSMSSGGAEMEIDALAKAMPAGVKFDFIGFDACYMGGIEVAYQLRNACNYFIGSSVETPIDGFAYDLIINDFASMKLEEALRKNYEYLRSLSGWEATCAMSLVDCAKLPELAAATKRLTVNSPRKLADIKFAQMQDLGSSSPFRATYYDLGDFVNETWASAPDLAAFNTALTAAAPTTYCLPVNLGYYQIDTFSGFSCFAPKPSQPLAIQAFRDRFDWGADSGIASM